MNRLLAYVKFSRGEWIVEVSRVGVGSAKAFSPDEARVMAELWAVLARVKNHDLFKISRSIELMPGSVAALLNAEEEA